MGGLRWYPYSPKLRVANNSPRALFLACIVFKLTLQRISCYWPSILPSLVLNL
jgi:hypothetical protein